MTKPAKPAPAARFFTAATMVVRPRWAPIVFFVAFCFSLAAIVAAFEFAARTAAPIAEPRFTFPGTSVEVDVPHSLNGYALWVEMRVPAADAQYTRDWMSREWAQDVIATDANGAPVVYEWDARLTGYVVVEGDEATVGLPIGVAPQAGVHIEVPDVNTVGIALGPLTAESRVTNLTPLGWGLPALVGLAGVFATVRPRQSFLTHRQEAEELHRLGVESARRSREASAAARHGYQKALEQYERDLAEWMAMGRDPNSPYAPTRPVEAAGGGALFGLIALLILVAPLVAAMGTAVAIARSGLHQLVVASPLTPFLPIAGDTSWRIVVMAGSLALLAGIGPLAVAMLATGFRSRRFRSAATIVAVATAAIAVALAALALTVPVERMTP